MNAHDSHTQPRNVTLYLQLSIAVVLGAMVGLGAVRVALHPHRPPASATQSIVQKSAPIPAIPYATAGTLLTHAGVTHAQAYVRIRHGQILLLVSPSSGGLASQRAPSPAALSHLYEADHASR
jgi:hypothetical protein